MCNSFDLGLASLWNSIFSFGMIYFDLESSAERHGFSTVGGIMVVRKLWNELFDVWSFSFDEWSSRVLSGAVECVTLLI